MILKYWFIEEIMLDGSSDAGGIGQRQTVMEFDSDTGEWIRPDDRIADGGEAHWDTIMNYMSDINGKDRSWIINPVRLMDYCNYKITGGLRPRPGTSGNGTEPIE